MRLSLDQRRVLADFLANIGVAWFAGGIVAPLFSVKGLSEIKFTGLWGIGLSIISISLALFVMRKKK